MKFLLKSFVRGRPAAGAGGGDVKAAGLEKTASGLEAGEGAVKAVSTSQ